MGKDQEFSREDILKYILDLKGNNPDYYGALEAIGLVRRNQPDQKIGNGGVIGVRGRGGKEFSVVRNTQSYTARSNDEETP